MKTGVRKNWWKDLPLGRKVSLVILILLLLVFPLMLLTSITKTNFFQKAASDYPGVCTGSCYSSKDNCQKNCGQPCILNPTGGCSWKPAYKCCRTSILIPTPTSIPAKKPTPSVNYDCTGSCYSSVDNCQKNCQSTRKCLKNPPGECSWKPAYKCCWVIIPF